ncbi:MAG: hypothetical protein V3U83_08930, partial [Acidobacteriota bacterium]
MRALAATGPRAAVGRRSIRFAPILFGLLALAMSGESAHAQETTVRASVDRVRIRTGDRITLTIDIEGGSSDQATA